MMNISIQATEEATHGATRVPAEWEPQEAVWIQWPGLWDKS